MFFCGFSLLSSQKRQKDQSCRAWNDLVVWCWFFLWVIPAFLFVWLTDRPTNWPTRWWSIFHPRLKTSLWLEMVRWQEAASIPPYSFTNHGSCFFVSSLFLPFFFSMFLFVLRRIFSALQPSTGLLWTGPSAPHQERIFLFRLALKTGHDWHVPVACVCVGCNRGRNGCRGFNSQRLHACEVILALGVVALVIACNITTCLQITWVK